MRWLAVITFLFVHALCSAQSVRYSVVISEVMADPSPVVQLPNAEYIELKNVSGSAINLQGWHLTTSTGRSNAFLSYLLPADSFLIITSITQARTFAAYGRALGITNFPSLNNDSATISLIAREGNVIHTVNYNTTWFGNDIKKEGGWSLEMRDTRNGCAGKENWTASTDAHGGTPGTKNSVDAMLTYNKAPLITNAYLLNDRTIIVQFDAAVDSANAATVARYSLSPTIALQNVRVLNPLLNLVQVTLTSPLNAATVYTLTVNNIINCKGNAIPTQQIKIGTPQAAATGDVVINEILFNPRPGGYDYVELYNRSKKIIDVSNLYIANRSSNGSIANYKKISNQPLYLFEGDYIVSTEDSTALNKQYNVQNKKAVVQISSLPSYPDDAGNVVITNINNAVIDEVAYHHNWHFPLISNKEGVALERIDPAGPSNNKDNWHSAATTAGYGTPGYQNSQYQLFQNPNVTINIKPAVFSPDNDGRDDVATVTYTLAESGYVANIFIYDASGRQVRHLVKNAVLGLQGFFTWNGLDEKEQRLPVGPYIIYTELFNLQGRKKVFKNTIILARPLR